MLEISGYSVEWIKDPFGIIPGRRYEFILDIQVDEEDELFSEQGLSLRVIYRVEEEREGIVKYEFLEKGTGKYLEFDMDEDEEALVAAFCKEHRAEEKE